MWFFRWLARLLEKPAPPAKVLVFTLEQGEFLSENERQLAHRETCPDCGRADSFIDLPRSQFKQYKTANRAAYFRCGNPACGSEFRSIFPFGVQRMTDACPHA